VSLVRAWRRQISGASGAALIVPIAVFGSMVLLALAGGFGALGGLGQAIAGPASPGGAPGAKALATADVRGVPASVLPVVARAGAATLVASVTLPGGPQRSSRGNSGSAQRPSDGNGNTGAVTPPTPTSSQPPSPGGPPVGQPSAPPTLTDGVVALGMAITSKVPGPLGQLATGALKSVGQTLDETLPGNARSAVSDLAGAVGSTVSRVGSGVSGVVNGLHVP
jgi:hypothetical protein